MLYLHLAGDAIEGPVPVTAEQIRDITGGKRVAPRTYTTLEPGTYLWTSPSA